MTTIISVKPAEIESKSFEIIEQEFLDQTGKSMQDFTPEEFRVLQRTIHATGDFSFSETIRFYDQAPLKAIEAIRAGKNILTDVTMVATGINKTLLSQWGAEVQCKIADNDTAALAAKNQSTRAEAAIQNSLNDQVGIIAIGNAPTALLHAIKLINDKPELSSIVVIGVPVGFVNAAESKDILHQSDIPHITCLGRKGGSPVAAAMVNALIKLAAGQG